MGMRTKLRGNPGLGKNWMQVTTGSPFSLSHVLHRWGHFGSVPTWSAELGVYCSLFICFVPISLAFLSSFSFCFYTPVVFLFLYYYSLFGVFHSKLLGKGSYAFGWLHSIKGHSPDKLPTPGFLLALALISVIMSVLLEVARPRDSLKWRNSLNVVQKIPEGEANIESCFISCLL